MDTHLIRELLKYMLGQESSIKGKEPAVIIKDNLITINDPGVVYATLRKIYPKKYLGGYDWPTDYDRATVHQFLLAISRHYEEGIKEKSQRDCYKVILARFLLAFFSSTVNVSLRHLNAVLTIEDKVPQDSTHDHTNKVHHFIKTIFCFLSNNNDIEAMLEIYNKFSNHHGYEQVLPFIKVQIEVEQAVMESQRRLSEPVVKPVTTKRSRSSVRFKRDEQASTQVVNPTFGVEMAKPIEVKNAAIPIKFDENDQPNHWSRSQSLWALSRYADKLFRESQSCWSFGAGDKSDAIDELITKVRQQTLNVALDTVRLAKRNNDIVKDRKPWGKAWHQLSGGQSTTADLLDALETELVDTMSLSR